MKRLQVWFALALAAGLALFVFQAEAMASGAPVAPLCLPRSDRPEGEDCQMDGPAAYLDQMAGQGILLPRNPLPAVPVDPAFGELPYAYVRLHDLETPLFTSLDEAKDNTTAYRIIPPGFNFVSYIHYFQGAGNGRHYMIDQGVWVRGGDTAGQVVPSVFVGLTFSGSPERQFGWTIYPTRSQNAPGNQGSIVRSLQKFEVIQVYQSIEADGITWLMIGPDEWVDKSQTALVYPAEAPPEGVTNGRWIEVNLFEQTISVYQQNRLVFATLTSTGIPGWWTRPGLFQITEKLESTPMSGAFEADRSDYYYLEDVPWTMYFDEARALHGAYWHNLFGYEQSHGCVNLSAADSHWLFLWANVGDYVYVWDPSGQTPTDPSLYTAGGA